MQKGLSKPRTLTVAYIEVLVQTHRIKKFLMLNGWERGKGQKNTYYKEDAVTIHIVNRNNLWEVSFMYDDATQENVPLNMYAVIGFMFMKRLILPTFPTIKGL